MTLLKKIENLIHFGYDITFTPQPMNVEIRVGKEVDGKNIYRKSWLPTNDHFYESKIVDCLDYMVKETESEILKEKNRSTELFIFKILDKNGIELPDHYSGRLRTLDQATKLLNRLNEHGEFRPYTMVKI